MTIRRVMVDLLEILFRMMAYNNYHRSDRKNWSSLALALVLILFGCAEGAKLAQRSAEGGVVTYPIKGDQSPMLSSFRKDALGLMKDACGGSYAIVREGETKGRARVVGGIEGGQEVVRERRWGIEFRCKESRP
jgi:hypothetical protein